MVKILPEKERNSARIYISRSLSVCKQKFQNNIIYRPNEDTHVRATISFETGYIHVFRN